MPPRAFPYALRVGTDICNVSRLRAVIQRRGDGPPLRSLSRFLTRILTYPERSYFWGRFGPPEEILTNIDAASQFLAGRFAAKEACRKACDHLAKDSRGFHQIMILPIVSSGRNEHQSSPPRGLILDKVYNKIHEENGEPIKSDGDPSIRDIAARDPVHVNELEGQLCEISISHDGDFATAVAIVPSMLATQTEEYSLSQPPPSEGAFPSAPTSWDDLLAETEAQFPISAENERRINEVVDKGLANIRRRNGVVDAIQQLRNEEQRTVERERKLIAECTLEDQQRWGITLIEGGLSVPLQRKK